MLKLLHKQCEFCKIFDLTEHNVMHKIFLKISKDWTWWLSLSLIILNDKLLHKKEILTQGKTEPIPPLLDEVIMGFVGIESNGTYSIHIYIPVYTLYRNEGGMG